MSSEWYERSYVSAGALWEFLDRVTQRCELLREEMSFPSGEKKGELTPSALPDLVFLGRKEVLREIGDLVHEQELPLREILREQGIDVRLVTDDGGEHDC